MEKIFLTYIYFNVDNIHFRMYTITINRTTRKELQMKKEIKFPSGFLIIEVQWISKKRLDYVVKCAELGRFDLLGMTTEDVKQILEEHERKVKTT